MAKIKVKVPPLITKSCLTTGFPAVNLIEFKLSSYEDEENAATLGGGTSAKAQRELLYRALVGQKIGDTTDRLLHHDGSSIAAYESWHPDLRTFYASAYSNYHDCGKAIPAAVVKARTTKVTAGKHVVYVYTVPKSVIDDVKKMGGVCPTSFGMRIASGENELAAMEVAGESPLRYLRALVRITLAEQNGEPISDAEDVCKAWHPKARNLALAIAALSLRSGADADFFSQEGNVEISQDE